MEKMLATSSLHGEGLTGRLNSRRLSKPFLGVTRLNGHCGSRTFASEVDRKSLTGAHGGNREDERGERSILERNRSVLFPNNWITKLLGDKMTEEFFDRPDEIGSPRVGQSPRVPRGKHLTG